MSETSILHIQALEINVNLGWTAEERSQKQTVRAGIEIRFFTPPAACINDELEHTICYAKLIDLLKQHIQDQRFHLIEHLAYTIHAFIKASLLETAAITVRLTKFPAIPGLLGGVHFSYGDSA